MIETRDLTRRFRVKRGFRRAEFVDAVRGVDLRVEPGELVAILGPNGAGKTTVLRMLTTLLRPSGGNAIVAGHDIERNQAGVRRNIGYVGQGNGAGQYHRVHDELVTHGLLYGATRSAARTKAAALLETLDLTPLRNRNVYTLSGGQRRRLDIAMGLMHGPRLLFLDEPSTGLDPQNRANLWDHIRRIRDEHGMTVVVTTHYMDEADRETNRVVIIDEGKIIADDSPVRLKSTIAGDRIRIAVEDARAAPRALEIALSIDGVHDGVIEHDAVLCHAGGAASGGTTRGARDRGVERSGASVLPVLLRELDRSGVMIAAAEVRGPTLDDVFLSLTGRRLREDDETAA